MEALEHGTLLCRAVSVSVGQPLTNVCMWLGWRWGGGYSVFSTLEVGLATLPTAAWLQDFI